MRFYPKYAYSVIRYKILFYIVIILYRLFTFDIMATNSKLPSIDIFDDIIKNLKNQITTTINVLSPDNKNKYCYQTSNDLVKELLNIIYIPIKYEFFIKYIGEKIKYVHNKTRHSGVFNPIIPENTYVSPSDIFVESKLSLDIHSNSNTIDTKTNKIIINININTSEFSNNSANAYMYMFQFAFGQLSNIKDDLKNLTIKDELFGPKVNNLTSSSLPVDPEQIHTRLSIDYTGFNNSINDTDQSIWKSAFLYKKFALKVSFTTITVSSNGQNRSISILEPTIRTVEYEPVQNRTDDNTSTQKRSVYAESKLPVVPKQNENVTSRTPHQGSRRKLPPLNLKSSNTLKK